MRGKKKKRGTNQQKGWRLSDSSGPRPCLFPEAVRQARAGAGAGAVALVPNPRDACRSPALRAEAPPPARAS